MRAVVPLALASLALAFPAMAQAPPDFTYDPSFEQKPAKPLRLTPYAYRSDPERFEAWADGDPMAGVGATIRLRDRSFAEFRYEQQFGTGTGSMFEPILPRQKEKFGTFTFRIQSPADCKRLIC